MLRGTFSNRDGKPFVWNGAVIDMIRPIDPDLEVGKLETPGFVVRAGGLGLSEIRQAVPMFHGEQSAISDIQIEL